MPVSIVVGGQFGSEGKGKVAHYLAQKMKASFAVRCGGPNSGHTVIDPSGKARIFQQLPTAAILPDVKLAICAGSYIDLDILLREIQETGAGPDRLIIDPDAVIITEEIKQREAQSGLIGRIGSTGSGTGAAVVARINREKSLLFARNVKKLSTYIQDVPDILRDSLDQNENVIIEGTQGFGLSLLHSRYFPCVTSRDTSAAGFLAETGLSPFDVKEIFLTIRSFPIRVSSNCSGPMQDEIDWEIISKEGNHKNDIIERTSVTKKIRRVARFSSSIVKKAIKVNRPTKIILNHLDYLASNYTPRRDKIFVEFINYVEREIGHPVHYLGFGPDLLCEKMTQFLEVVNV
jgi:adenylosuccinate synthase